MNYSQVAIYKTENAQYPEKIPYHPDKKYPEYVFSSICSGEKNFVYESVRKTLILMNLDKENIGQDCWNPLAELINPGQTVLIKPNFVKEYHPRDPEGWKYVITHGSMIRAVCDYVWKAIGKEGQIIVADAPQTDSSFTKIASLTGLMELKDFYLKHGYNLAVRDLRQEEWINEGGVITQRKTLKGDPEGYVLFNLGENSEFYRSPQEERFYGADYDKTQVNKHHCGEKHEYLISATAINADVVISLPKLKTHKKAGITVSLKNLVGINGDKNYLPHHTEGAPENGGDEFPFNSKSNTLERSLKHFFQNIALRVPIVGPQILKCVKKQGQKILGDSDHTIRNGNWYGNDTVWKMCLDLNKILLYGNKDGTFRRDKPENRKPHYVFVDGIIAGEGNGPMDPDPVKSGLVLFGINPAIVDATCATVMGFDPEKIKIINNAFSIKNFRITGSAMEKIKTISNYNNLSGKLTNITPPYVFKPHFGWIGRIEKSQMTSPTKCEPVEMRKVVKIDPIEEEVS